MRLWDSERMHVAWQDPTPLTQASLREFQEVVNRDIKRICDQMQAAHFKAALGLNREGISHMTETNVATLDTPEGTIVRLREGHDDHLTAQAGALARVTGSNSEWLYVTWLSRHTDGNARQQDGGYYAHHFEVLEFQEGDRVRVVESPFEQGYEGVITEIPAQNGDDCVVAVDTPYSSNLSYRFGRLAKVREEEDGLSKLRDLLQESWNPENIFANDPFDAGEEADEPRGYIEEDEADDEPEEEREFEVGDLVTIKGYGPWDGPGEVTKVVGNVYLVHSDNEEQTGGFYASDLTLRKAPEWKVGDVVVIVPVAKRDDLAAWSGLRFRVKRVDEHDPADYVLLEAIDTRPDGYGVSDFFWETRWLRAFDPATDFRVGDIVDATNLSADARGVVTRLTGDFNGDIEVNWETGTPAIVETGPLGYTRDVAGLVGVHPEGEDYKAPGTPVEEKVAEEGEEVTIKGNVSGHYLRPYSQATVQAVTLLEDGSHKGRYEYKVLGKEKFDGSLLTQFLFSDDVEKYEAPAIEVGAEITSSDVLDDLPLGTALIRNNDAASPLVKLGQGFGRLNRWSSDERDTTPMASFEDAAMAADSEQHTLTIAYLPNAA